MIWGEHYPIRILPFLCRWLDGVPTSLYLGIDLGVVLAPLPPLQHLASPTLCRQGSSIHRTSTHRKLACVIAHGKEKKEIKIRKSLPNVYLIIKWRDFYFRALGSLVVLSFPQPLNFSSVLPKPLSETLTRSSDGRNPVKLTIGWCW
jgi:hypothetical protein